MKTVFCGIEMALDWKGTSHLGADIATEVAVLPDDSEATLAARALLGRPPKGSRP